MRNSRKLKIELNVNLGPALSTIAQRMMTEALADFMAAPDPKPDDYLSFEFQFRDKNGELYELKPYQLVRSSIRPITNSINTAQADLERALAARKGVDQ